MTLTSDMLNNPVGAVTYTPNNSANSSLHARWAFSAQEDVHIVCQGTAIRQKTGATPPQRSDINSDTRTYDPFIGTYHIAYTGPDGHESDPWDLLITKRDEIYHAIWSKNDIVHYHGIGFVSQGDLICGWRPIT